MGPEVMCLAFAIYFEARSETIEGQQFVAKTIENRVVSKAYPDTICDVIHQRRQFSFYNKTAEKGVELVISETKAWNKSQQLAQEIFVNGNPIDHNACHYAKTYVRNKWTRKFKKVANVGKHSFYVGGCGNE